MCNLMSNAMLNTLCLVAPTLPDMHPSMERLYLAAQTLGKVTGQSNVARALLESPQTVKNWETRGISDAGAIKAEGAFGCRAHWLTTGTGDMAFASQPAGPALAPNALVAQLAAMLDSLGNDALHTAQERLKALAVSPDSQRARDALVAAFAQQATTPAPGGASVSLDAEAA